MPNQGYQIDPVVTEFADGEFVTDFAVKGSDNRMQAIEYMNNHQDEWVHTDQYGNQSHELALENPEVSQLLEDDFIPETTEEDFVDPYNIEEVFQQQTIDYVGSEENYQKLCQYADAQWDAEDVEKYDAIMASPITTS